MKKVYLVDVDCGTSLAQGLVNVMNEKVSCLFTSRKKAIEHLVESYHYLKERFGNDIKAIKRHCKLFQHYGEVITIDCYIALVDDEFDIETDSIFEEASDNYHIIDSRYLLGRY